MATKCPTADELYEALKHGDREHQRWLKAAINAVYSGQTVPFASGKSTRVRVVEAIEAKDFEPPEGAHIDSFWVGHTAACAAVMVALDS